MNEFLVLVGLSVCAIVGFLIVIPVVIGSAQWWVFHIKAFKDLRKKKQPQ